MESAAIRVSSSLSSLDVAPPPRKVNGIFAVCVQRRGSQG